MQALIDAVNFSNLARRFRKFNSERKLFIAHFGKIFNLKNFIKYYLLSFACVFAREGNEVLAKSPLATALATWHIEFCNVFRRCLKVSEKLPEHYLHDRIVFRVIFFFVLSFVSASFLFGFPFSVLRILSLLLLFKNSFFHSHA